MAFTSDPATISEVANFVLGNVWTAVSQSWHAKAAAIFFVARPFLIAAIGVWGLKNAAEILARGLENAAEILARSLENAAENQARSLEITAHILTHGQVYSAGGTTMVGLRAGAARAPHSSPFYIARR